MHRRQFLLLLSALGAQSAVVLPGVASYSAALLQHPLETNVLTAVAISAAGDAIVQRSEWERSGKPYDTPRAISFVLFGAFYQGAFNTRAFPWIQEHCKGDALQALASSLAPDAAALADPSLYRAVECTAFSQLLVVPLVYYPIFFAVTGCVQGLTAEESVERARGSFVGLQLRNWKFWWPVQLCQFGLLPPEWQVPYACAMGLVWNVILSAAAGSAREPDDSEEPGGPAVGVVVPMRQRGAARVRAGKILEGGGVGLRQRERRT